MFSSSAPSLKSVDRHITAKFGIAEDLVARLLPPETASGPEMTLPPGLPIQPPGQAAAKKPARRKRRGRDQTAEIAQLAAELASLQVAYSLATGSLFVLEARGESTRAEAREQFQTTVASGGFVGDLENLFVRACGLLSAAAGAYAAQHRNLEAKRRSASSRRAGVTRPRGLDRGDAREIERFFGHQVNCTSGAVGCSASQNKDHDRCSDCGVEMLVDPDASELRCGECGVTRPLIGRVFDEAQFYSQEGQKAKSGTSGYNRHYQYWIDRILAREPLKEIGDPNDPDNLFGEKLIEDIEAIVRRDNYLLLQLTPDDVRQILHELGRTDLNKNTAQILKKLTGVGPPSVPEAICQRVERQFSRAVAIGATVRPAGRTNLNYYPYYIYKLFDAALPLDDRENRRILYYIYLQKQGTLEDNDIEWRDICSEMPDVEFRPTDRAMALAYRPE